MKDLSESLDNLISRVHLQWTRVSAWTRSTTTIWPELLLTVFVGAVVLYVVRNMWFFGDDWNMLIFRRQLMENGEWFRYLFAPHNEHLSTVVILVMTGLQSLFGVGSAVPFLAVVVIAHVAIVWVIRCFLVRFGVPMIPRMVAILWFGLLGAGAENLVWPFQMAYIGALALTLWGLYFVTTPEPKLRTDIAACLLFLAGLFTAGTAIPVLIVSVVLVLWNRRWGQALRVFALPVVIYVAWFVFYGASRQPEHPSALTQVVPYMTRGISFGLDQIVQFSVLGFVAGVVALVVLVMSDWVTGLHRQTLLTLVSAIAVFFLMGGLGRSYFGVEQSEAVRYVYVLGALAIPLLIVIGSRAVTWRPRFAYVAWGFVLIAIVGNVGALIAFRNDRIALTNDAKWKFASAVEYLDVAQVADDVRPEPTYNPDVSIKGLRFLRDQGLWSSNVRLSEAMQLDAAARFGLRTGFESKPQGLDLVNATIVSIEGATASISGECTVLQPTGATPQVVLQSKPAATFSIDTHGAPSMLYVRSQSDPELHSVAIDTGTAGATAPVWVMTFPLTGQPVLVLPTGVTTTLCGIATR